MSADQTRAGGGSGRPAGTVSGALPEFELPARADRPGTASGTVKRGFDAATSKRVQKGVSATVDVFENADGTVTRKVYAQPVNFRAGNGTWQPIDTSLRRAPDGRWSVGANDTAVSFAPSGGQLVSMTLPSGQSVGYGLAGAAAVTPSVSGSTATYPLILPETDLELVALPHAVKETLILRSARAANEWVFPLQLEGLTPRLEGNGSVALLDGAGKPVAVIPPGTMNDSNRDAAGESAHSSAVTYELITVDGGPALKMTADVGWLNDPARVFPVRVDPTIQPGGNASTFVQRNNSDSCCVNDNSGATILKTGYHSSGPWYTRAFVKFDNFSSDYLGYTIHSATLQAHVVWVGRCASSYLRVYDVDPWSASGVRSWGNAPALWGQAGSVQGTPNSDNCSLNDEENPEIGQWWGVPMGADGLAMLNRWTSGGANNGIALVSDLNADNANWKKIASVWTTRPPHFDIVYTPTQAPVVQGLFPPHGYGVPTLTPELIVAASDPDNGPQPLKYYFQVFDATGTTVVAGSGGTPISSRTWTVPPGALEWGKAYVWTAAAFDGAVPSAPYPGNSFVTQVPQPLITSGLAQNTSAHGFDPKVGNYTTQATDANIATTGPALAIQRSYNSRDPRNGGAFGAGWSSVLDSRLARAGHTMTVTYPTGQDVAFGLRPDGTYAPPSSGLASSIRSVAGGYQLIDQGGTKYAFTVADGTDTWKLSSVTDALNRTLTLQYTSGRVTALRSESSGRKLTMRWTTTGTPRVDQVSTDPTTPGDSATVNVWRYSYVGDRLDKVCRPEPAAGTACTSYAYGTNSLYPTAVFDARPHTYLRLGEAAGTPAATSSTVDSIDPVTGVYRNVSEVTSAGIPGTSVTAPRFNGASSLVELGKSAALNARFQTVSLRFKTDPGGFGVLYSLRSVKIPESGATGWDPVLYVGSDGKLYGEMWQGAVNPLVSTSLVNDGNWHHAVLAVAGNSQTLYLDGTAVGTRTGEVMVDNLPFGYIGAGQWTVWPGNNGVDLSYFKGQISDVALYAHELHAAQVATMRATSMVASAPLTQFNDPSGNVRAVVEYDPALGAVRKVTDGNGGVWQIQDPVRADSGQVYRSAVLSRAPQDYYRFADTGPAQAVNEVNGNVATYNNVTLGVDGGPLSDDLDVATFNGTSSYVQLPPGDEPSTGPASVSMWFKTTGSGVLYSYQSGPIGGANPIGWVPALYIGTDGKLRGKFWSNSLSGELTTAQAVNDGKWHHVVLAASTNSQSLYVDGALAAGPVSGVLDRFHTSYHASVGAGRWQNWTATSGETGYFNGQIAEFAFYRNQLTQDHALAQFSARTKNNPENPAPLRGVPVKIVNVLDPASNLIQNVYDLSSGRQIETVDARGKRTTIGYDTGGFARTVTDPNKNVTVTERDGRGNVRAQTTCQDQSENRCSTTYFSYFLNAGDPLDPRNDKLTEVRDARSESESDNRFVTRYNYDTAGNLIDITDPLGRKRTHEFTAAKHIVADFTGLSANARYVRVYGTQRGTGAGYSLWELEVYGGGSCVNLARGRPATSSSNVAGPYESSNATDGLETTRWSSEFSDPHWIYVDLGAAKPIDRVRLNWEVAYGKDYLVQVSNDASTWTTIKTVTNQSGAFVPAGLPSRIVSAGGSAQQVSYGANGDIVRTVDAAGLATCFKRDGIGRVVEQTVSSDTYPKLVTTIGYDRLDRVVSATEPLTINAVTGAQHTKRTVNSYNVDGNLLSTTFSDVTGGDAARTVTAEYNQYGQKTSQSDARNNKTLFEYDAFGRQTKQTAADGTVTETGYDAAGNEVTTKVNGQLISSNAYDDGGRLASATDAMGWQTLYTYTDNNLPVSQTRKDPSTGATFVVESNGYDQAGNLVSQTTNNGTTTTAINVDAAGRATWKTLDAAGVNRTISYAYGADDTVLAETISGAGGAHTTDSRYDAAGRLIWQGIRVPGGTGGPSAWWQLNEASGTVAADSSAGSRHATASGTVSWADGAASFAGAGSLGTAGPVLDSRQGYTVAVWAKLATTSELAGVVSQDGNRVSAFVLEYHKQANRWVYWMPHSDVDNVAYTAVGSTDAPTLNQWTHLAAVYDSSAGVMKLYVNGVLQGTQAAPTAITSTGPLRISGSRYNAGNGAFFQGGIDNVAAYQRVLSDSEVVSSFHAGRGGAAHSQDAIATSWTRDQFGNVVTQTDPNGNVSTFTYDEASRVVRSQSATVNIEEDDVITSAKILNTTGYDTFGGVVEQRDGRGLVTRTERDANGMPTKVFTPAYTAPGSSTPMTGMAQTTYDNMGRAVTVTDPLGRETVYTYDQFGQVKTVRTPDLGVTTYTYHPDGGPASVTDPTGGISQATHDYLGRQATTTKLFRRTGQPTEVLTTSNLYYAQTGWLYKVVGPETARGSTVYEYNNVGEVVKTTDAAGNISLTTYDFAGRVAQTQLPDLSKTKTTYDVAGRPTTQQQLNPSGTVLRSTSATYDSNGNVVTATDARGTVTTFNYDTLGRVTQTTQPISATDSIINSFGYDANGQRTRYTDGRGGKFRTTYNSWNLPESEIDPGGATFTAVYDLAGRVDRNLAPGGVTNTMTYDVMDNVERITGSGAETATADKVFDYDALGRLTSLSGPGGTNILTYDDRNLLESVTGPSGNSSYSYTKDGLLSSRTDAAGTTDYTYDVAGRLKTIGNNAAALYVSYDYNNLSQVSQLVYGNSQNRRVFGYDALHRLETDELKTAGGASLGKITYGWDLNDNETSKTTVGFSGAGTNTYTYDLANRLKTWNGMSYAYDKSGNRTQAGSKTFTYDAANRLQTASDGTTYDYTARGTLRRTTTGTVSLDTVSDAFDQVIKQYYSATQFSEYTYDGLGRVMQAGFAYTGLGNDLAADPAASYIRDPGGGLAGSKSGASAVYAWTDLHDDVVGQFTATGTALAGSTTYEPFGKVVSTSGTQGSLGYQSEWTDAQTKRVNMHARWYNPETGQFDSRDAVGTPNRHNYAENNPLTRTDPTGHYATEGIDDYVGGVGYNPVGRNGLGHHADIMTNKRHAAAEKALREQNNKILAALATVSPCKVYTGDENAWGNGGRAAAQAGCNGTRDRTVKQCQRAEGAGDQAHTYQNCTTVVIHADGSATFNGVVTLSSGQMGNYDPTLIAKQLDVIAGSYGGYTDGPGGDRAIITAAALDQAIDNVVKRSAETDRTKAKAKCDADWWCKNKNEIIGTTLDILIPVRILCRQIADAQKCDASSVMAASVAAAVGCGLVSGGALSAMCAVGVSGLMNVANDALQNDVHMSSDILGSFAKGAAVGAVGLGAGAVGGALSRGLSTAARIAIGSAGGAAASAMGDFIMTGEVNVFNMVLGAVTGGVGGKIAGGKGGAACRNSFSSATKVVTATGATAAIASLAVGDRVIATDPETGETTTQPITAVHVNIDTDLVDVTVRGGDGATATIHSTGHHLFWDKTSSEWAEAAALVPGRSTLRAQDGSEVEVAAVRTVAGPAVMHDLTVDTVHTFYVTAGAKPALVHNKDVYACPIPGLVVPQKSIIAPAVVYRGDRRIPSVVGAIGFTSRGTNMDLMKYVVENGLHSPWVGTSSSKAAAAAFPFGKRGVPRWVYEIRNPGVGIDVNKALGWRFRLFNDRAKEHEVIFPQIDPTTISQAWEYKLGQPTGQHWVNPDFRR